MLSALILLGTISWKLTSEKNVENCASLDGRGVCSKCETGYFLAQEQSKLLIGSLSTKCVKCQCRNSESQCVDFKGCTSCGSGYFKAWSGSSIKTRYVDCKKCDENCESNSQCQDFRGCSSCRSGYEPSLNMIGSDLKTCSKKSAFTKRVLQDDGGAVFGMLVWILCCAGCCYCIWKRN